MSMINMGTQGAKRQAMKNEPLLRIAQEIAESAPKDADLRDNVFARQFERAVEADEDAIQLKNMVFEYVWANIVHRITKPEPTAAEKAARKQQSLARVERARLVILNKQEARARQMFLDMTMPNGKLLRNCTFKEVGTMQSPLAKLFRHLATTGKPKQKVGDVYKTNEELIAAAKLG